MSDKQNLNAETKHSSRRKFLAHAGKGLAAAGVIASTTANENIWAQQNQGQNQPPPNVNTQQPIQLPPFVADTERQTEGAPLPLPPSERVGFAIVGLGRLSIAQILPAFGACKKAKPVALVSGSPDKARQVAAQYGIKESSVYNYQNFDQIRDNPEVKVVYVVLPNSMHLEYTKRAAAAGKHVLCEKPMATNPQECEQMIAACRQANVKLMIAYRIQYEPNNRMIREMVRKQQFGPVKLIEAVNGQRQGDPNQWRHKLALAGGGSLPDVGLYCLNTIRFILGEEPTEVSGYIYSTPNDPRFREVEENVAWQMRFPSGALANCMTGYDYHESRRYRVYMPLGWFGLDPAFSYEGLQMQMARAEGKVEHAETPRLGSKNQFALEMDHLAECVLENKSPFTPGEEGLQDHRIMAAIYEAARSGRPVKLPASNKLDAFRGPEPKSS